MDNTPQVSDRFKRGVRNGIIIALIFFWVPLGITITWLVNR